MNPLSFDFDFQPYVGRAGAYPEQINEVIKELYSQGYSGREIAKMLGMCKTSVLNRIKQMGLSRPKNQYKDEFGRFVKKDQQLPIPIKKYRKLAFRYLPNECYYCKTTENLQVHHIDRNRNNNTLENLRIVCARCHMHKEHPYILKRKRDKYGRFIKEAK